MAINTTYDFYEHLKNVMKRCAKEIEMHGADSLYKPGQFVTSGRITIDLDVNAYPTITYEREVVPDPRDE